MPDKSMTLEEFEDMSYDMGSTVVPLNDFDNIGETEIKPRTTREKNIFGELSTGIDLTLGGTPSNVGKAMIMFGDFIRENSDRTVFGTKPVIDTKPLGERITSLGMRIYARNQSALRKRQEEAGETDVAGQFARDVGSGIVSLGSALGLGVIASPAAAGVAFGASAGAEGYIGSRKAGKGYQESVRIAQLMGFAEGSLEFIGIDRLIRASGGILKRAAKGYVTEFIQETSQSLANNTIRVASGLREFNTVDDLSNIMSEALYEGSIGGILGGPAAMSLAVAQRQSLEDGFKVLGADTKKAREFSEIAMKKGMDDVMSAVETLELGASNEIKEGILNESGKLVIPDLPFMKSEKAEELYQNIVNRFQSIENTVTRAKELGADILPGEDAGISADRYLSIGNQAENVLNNGTYNVTKEGNLELTGEGLRPILRFYDQNSPEQNEKTRNKDLDDYLIAKRTVEDLQRRAEKGGKNIASEKQVKEAKKTLNDLNKKYGESINVFDQTAQRIYDYQKRVLLSLVESNNISRDLYDAILSLNQNYIPFYRVLPEDDFSGIPINRRRFSGARSPVKKIKGSELDIEDPIESVIKNTYIIMDRSSRNKVFSDIYALREIKELGIEETTKTGKGIIDGYIEGKPTHLKVSKNLYQAMSGLNEHSSSLLVKLLSAPARALRIGATITPEFVVRNVLRDQWIALIQTDLGFRPFIDSIGSIADITGQSEVYNDWIRSGGSYAGFVELSRPALGKMLDELQGKKNTLRNIVMTPANISQLMEQATRVGVFKSALREGKTLVEAARESRESTLNFARRGAQTKELNAMIAFFNAGIQGLDKSIRVAKNDPIGFTTKSLATITIPSLFFYLLNRDEPEYYELPRWQKDLFWIFKWGDNWIRIPKPFLYGQIFGSLPERFFEFVDTKDLDAFDELSQSLYESALPVGSDPVSGILPTALKPLVENQTNWNFFRDRPIVPTSKQRLIPSEQYGKYTSKTARNLGKILNVSPSKIENLVQGWFGGSGRYALNAGDNFIDFVRSDDFEPKRPGELADVPLVKGFVARSPVGNQSESVNRFYKRKSEIDVLFNTFNKFKKEDKEKAKRLKENNPELSLSPKLRRFSKKFRVLEKSIDGIVKNKKLSDNEKRQAIRELEKQKTELAIEANGLIDKNL